MKKKNKPLTGDLLFVSLYITLGDADGSIEGQRIISKEDWEKDVAVFQDHLASRKGKPLYHESVWGDYMVDMTDYTVKSCTAAEAEVIEKFFGRESGDFRLPSEFTKKNY